MTELAKVRVSELVSGELAREWRHEFLEVTYQTFVGTFSLVGYHRLRLEEKENGTKFERVNHTRIL